MSLDFEVSPGGAIRGQLRVPGDKSISHRSVMLASIAEGRSEVNGFLEGEDSLATLRAFRAMGVQVTGPENGTLRIEGVGLHGLIAPEQTLDLGNSGTSMRLMAGLLCAQAFDCQLIGDGSLMNRPMARVVKPLSLMGAQISTGENGCPPLSIKGGASLHGIDHQLEVASAQVKSALLLAGLYADGRTVVREPAPTRDHTERMLRGFGYEVEVDGPLRAVQGGAQLHGARIDVPADISSAAFFLVAASIAPNSELLLQHVGMNPTRVGVINILRLMGANIEVVSEQEVGGEPVADLLVRSAPLQGIEIPVDQVPLAIDEFPVLFITAACASGRTVLRGAEELRVKESDRLEAMANGLRKMGVQVDTWEDGLEITGGPLTGAQIDSHGDHRIAMAFAVAALRASGTVRINDCANVATSFPRFVELSADVGLQVAVATD